MNPFQINLITFLTQENRKFRLFRVWNRDVLRCLGMMG